MHEKPGSAAQSILQVLREHERTAKLIDAGAAVSSASRQRMKNGPHRQEASRQRRQVFVAVVAVGCMLHAAYCILRGRVPGPFTSRLLHHVPSARVRDAPGGAVREPVLARVPREARQLTRELDRVHELARVRRCLFGVSGACARVA